MSGAEWASAHLVAAARDGHVERLPFPVGTGAHGSPHEAVGLQRAVFGTLQQSGTVVLDRAGLVQYTKAATIPTAGYDRGVVLRTLTTLR